ncbi:hypothetical protein Hdeb2414_s0015g00449251 [Helianthus debilis subsp. tardiflorus]
MATWDFTRSNLSLRKDLPLLKLVECFCVVLLFHHGSVAKDAESVVHFALSLSLSLTHASLYVVWGLRKTEVW